MTDLSIAQGSTYAHVILDATLRFAGRPAMRWKGKTGWQTDTYSDLRREILSLAAALRAKGISKGDRIGIWLETSRDWIVCDLAIQVVGAVTAPVYHTLTPEKARKILEDAEVKALISTNDRFEGLKRLGSGTPPFFLEIAADSTSIEGRATLNSLRDAGGHMLENQPGLRSELESPRVAPEDLSAIIYTSGTTGEPKGAMLTHAAVAANARSGAAAFLHHDHHRVFLHLPMAHVVGRNAVEAATLTAGGVLAIAEPEREKLVSNLRELAPTEVVTVPYVLGKFRAQVLQRLEGGPRVIRWLFAQAMAVARRCRVEPVTHGGPVQQKKSPLLAFYDRLFFRKIRGFLGGEARQIVTGAAHIGRETLEFFWAIGIPIYEGYGMTECTSNAAFTWEGDMKLGTVGRPAKGMEVKLALDGEILVRGVGLMKGYWKRPEATREAIDAEGWYHTGDLGSIDEGGYLRILDRKKEIFVLSTGKNVAPQSVENTLKRSLLVENACVFGDKRNYMTALIVPEWSAVQKKLSLAEKPPLEDPKLQKLFADEVKRLMEEIPDYERIKRFALATEPFSVENNMLTPTLKLRRKQIEEHYRNAIEALYSGPQSNFWFLDQAK
jgi:long-chain acyl-CoA synthetase